MWLCLAAVITTAKLHYSFTHEPNVPNIRHIRGYWRMDAYIREFSNDYISNGYISSNGYICKSGYL